MNMITNQQNLLKLSMSIIINLIQTNTKSRKMTIDLKKKINNWQVKKFIKKILLWLKIRMKDLKRCFGIQKVAITFHKK